MNPLYFRGVAVGLLIAWVTSAIAYYISGNSSPTLLPKLIIFEIIVSVIMFIAAFFIKG